jgi:hypothetical protein
MGQQPMIPLGQIQNQPSQVKPPSGGVLQDTSSRLMTFSARLENILGITLANRDRLFGAIPSAAGGNGTAPSTIPGEVGQIQAALDRLERVVEALEQASVYVNNL